MAVKGVAVKNTAAKRKRNLAALGFAGLGANAWLWRGLALATLVLLVLAASWFLVPVWKVDVVGSKHLRSAEVAALASASPRSPWFWINENRAAALLDNPWVKRASIEKRFPGQVKIEIVERVPFARILKPRQEPVVVASDGVVLPNANIPSLAIAGWGKDRLFEALKILALMPNAKSLEYSPSGFRVVTPTGSLWTDSAASLRKYAGNVKILSNSRVNVYPWGVTVKP